jgi:hypothetical protein
LWQGPLGDWSDYSALDHLGHGDEQSLASCVRRRVTDDRAARVTDADQCAGPRAPSTKSISLFNIRLANHRPLTGLADVNPFSVGCGTETPDCTWSGKVDLGSHSVILDHHHTYGKSLLVASIRAENAVRRGEGRRRQETGRKERKARSS